VKALEAALARTLNDKAVQEKFLNTGAELVTDTQMTSAGFTAFIKREFEQTREAAKLAGITPT
jgi:tripartite-type tricarboxylate transporter receptor subunit TctC